MSLEGGRREGRGGEGRGGEGGEGGREEGGREEGGEGGRGGMTVIHIILMAPYIQTNNEELYLYNNDVTYYNIRLGLRRTTMVRITFDVTWTPRQSATQLKSQSWSPN